MIKKAQVWLTSFILSLLPLSLEVIDDQFDKIYSSYQQLGQITSHCLLLTISRGQTRPKREWNLVLLLILLLFLLPLLLLLLLLLLPLDRGCHAGDTFRKRILQPKNVWRCFFWHIIILNLFRPMEFSISIHKIKSGCSNDMLKGHGP